MAKGGAWKVAYADFITAMMALFMVLWILGAEEELLEQMQEYFRNPPSPWEQVSGKYMVDVGEFSTLAREEHQENAFFENVDPAVLRGIIQEFQRLLQIEAEQGDAPPVEMLLTSDGLRMIIFDKPETRFFEDDAGTELTEWGEFLIQNLAWLLSRYEFLVEIEGHSGSDVEGMEEAGLSGNLEAEEGGEYGPWELSVDRANAIRSRLQFFAGGDVGIRRVSGYGDTQPLDESLRKGRPNQRITLSLSIPTEGRPPQSNRMPEGAIR